MFHFQKPTATAEAEEAADAAETTAWWSQEVTGAGASG